MPWCARCLTNFAAAGIIHAEPCMGVISVKMRHVEESDVLRFSPCREIVYTNYRNKEKTEERALISEEVTMPVIIDGEERGALIASPQDLYHLTIGYVLAEGLVRTYADIESVVITDGRALVTLTKEGHEKPSCPVDRLGPVAAEEICSYGSLLILSRQLITAHTAFMKGRSCVRAVKCWPMPKISDATTFSIGCAALWKKRV